VTRPPLPATEAAIDAHARRLSARFGVARVSAQVDALRAHGPLVEDPELWLETAVARNFKRVELEAVATCPCGSADDVVLDRFVYWDLLAVRRCRGCGLLRTSPRLSPAAVAWVFEQHYFGDGDPSAWDARRLPVFADVLRILRRCGSRRVFDVGTAYGHFLAWAKRHGIDGAGCDLNGAAVAYGRERLGVEVHHGRVQQVPETVGRFDAVVSIDAFYYAADPVAELLAMRRLLRPGGFILLRLRNCVTVPLLAALRRRRRIDRWVMPHEHLWGFTPSSLRPLLARAGLRLERCEPAAYSASALAPLRAAQVAAGRASAAIGLPILTHSFNAVVREKSA
jgi:SAM-dependent methyltransferase